ncbi:hypothetical protein ACU4HD_43360 [Cupriavidus basilensis]
MRVDMLRDVVIVPGAAIQRGGTQGTFVYVVGDEQQGALRVVKLGGPKGNGVGSARPAAGRARDRRRRQAARRFAGRGDPAGRSRKRLAAGQPHHGRASSPARRFGTRRMRRPLP